MKRNDNAVTIFCNVNDDPCRSSSQNLCSITLKLLKKENEALSLGLALKSALQKNWKGERNLNEAAKIRVTEPFKYMKRSGNTGPLKMAFKTVTYCKFFNKTKFFVGQTNLRSRDVFSSSYRY